MRLDGTVPTFADWDALPEVCAFVQEVYRWRPVTPLGAYLRFPQTNYWDEELLILGVRFTGFVHRATKDVSWVRTFCISYLCRTY